MNRHGDANGGGVTDLDRIRRLFDRVLRYFGLIGDPDAPVQPLSLRQRLAILAIAVVAAVVVRVVFGTGVLGGFAVGVAVVLISFPLVWVLDRRQRAGR